MKVRLFLVLLLLMSFSTFSQATCIPAPDPDLNNDSIVNSADLLIVTRHNGVAKGNPRYNPLADTNCDGKVNPTDIHFVNKAFGQTFPIGPKTTVGVDIMPKEVEIIEGEARQIALGLSFTSSSNDILFTIKITQSITPTVSNALIPSLNGTTFTFSKTSFKEFEQKIPVLPIGEYLINTTVTIAETGQSETKTTKVAVKSPSDPILDIGTPSMGVQALAVDSVKTLKPFVAVAGKDMEEVTAIRIKSLDLKYSTLLTRSDIQIYDGVLTVDTHGMQIGECVKFVAEVTTTKGILTSKPDVLCVTSFPTEFQPYKTVWSDTVIKGTHFPLNSFYAVFNDGVSEQKIKELVAKINGKIMDVSFNSNPRIYSIVLDPYPSTLSELGKLMTQFKSNPEVRQVEMNFGVPLSSTQPNDPEIDAQSWLSTIRADEAWYVTQGSSTRAIAVLDSGIVEHIDLYKKIITDSSKDFVNNGLPNHYHGTHVAGVAAAKVNNGEGIAGVASDTPLIDVKIADENGIALPDIMVAGIKHSATLKKPIVNLSMGFHETQDWYCSLFGVAIGDTNCYSQSYIDVSKVKVCDALKLAIDKKVFFVAAAGNSNTTDKIIPGACGATLTVGGTKYHDRWMAVGVDPDKVDYIVGSDYGSWVDIAAPAADILSTMPGHLYATTSGTSESTPMVSGAAAVLMSRHPDWTNQQIADRLKYTAHSMLDAGLGWGELDVFDAVFNGSFELIEADDKTPAEWKKHPNINTICESKTDVLGLFPENPLIIKNKRMLVCDNTGVRYEGIMNEFDVPEGVTQLPISFDWRMVAEDLNANGSVKTTLVNGSQMIKRDDRVVIRVYNTETKDLSMVDVIPLSLLLSTYNSGQPLVQASNGWYGNNWQTLKKSVPVTKGKNQLQIQVVNSGWNSTGDAIDLRGTTLFMMDRLRFRLN